MEQCEHCGEEHGPVTVVCGMEEEPRARVRRRCPFHKRLCYGEQRFYYDTMRIFFDCGTAADYGYGGWWPPMCQDCYETNFPAKGEYRLSDGTKRRVCGVHARSARARERRVKMWAA